MIGLTLSQILNQAIRIDTSGICPGCGMELVVVNRVDNAKHGVFPLTGIELRGYLVVPMMGYSVGCYFNSPKEPNLRGDQMRKMISFIVMGVLFIALFPSPAQALQYDPKKPRVDQMIDHSESGDDIGWDDPQTSPPRRDLPLMHLVSWNWSFIGLIIYDFVIDTSIDSDEHGSTDNIDTEGSSGANLQ